MNFINLQTGKVYNGDSPYIHYFNNSCCVNMMNSMPLCFISDKSIVDINIYSTTFFLINMDLLKNINEEIINDFKYYDINNLKSTSSIKSTGIEYSGKYIHIIYIGLYANQPAEYVDEMTIDNNNILIGADVYDDNESLYINMSNMGINIPNAIQKAIYPSNVHDDVDDKILLNRKWKELLSNYWDIIANKGSYKSLINSLKWFEWGDILKIKELWKYSDVDKKVKYKEEDLKQFISNLYSAEMSRFAKTTYYSINAAMYELGETVDENNNPIVLEKYIELWTKQDISLKLSLLGSFFETYFLPIHLDLIKSTIEDIVFTNNIKISCKSNNFNCHTYIPSEFIKCNLNNDTFLLSNISSQVNNKTLFNTGIQDYDNVYIMGVDKVIDKIDSDEELKLFMSQNFTGIGVIINVQYDIPLNKGDFIQSEQLFIKSNKDNQWIRSDENKLLFETDNYAHFEFNILCQEEAKYDLKINFITGTGKILSKSVNFNVIDDIEINIGVFRIKNLQPSLEEWYNGRSNEYNIYRENSVVNNSSLLQYIPVDKNRKTGIRLNTLMIFYIDDIVYTQFFEENHEYLRDNYFITHNVKNEYDEHGELIHRHQYTICVSKEFYEPGNYNSDPTEWLNTTPDSPKQWIYKLTQEYFPEFHYLEELAGNTLDDYTAYDNDALCVIPFVAGDRKDTLNYGKYIETIAWTFENITTGQIITLDNSIKEPYISNSRLEKTLDYGYYNIYFKYKLGNNIKHIKMDSAFRKIKKEKMD